MEKITTEKAKQIIEENIAKIKESEKGVTIEGILEQNLILKYMPQNIDYKAINDKEEKMNQLKNVIDAYSNYMCLLRQISSAKSPEFLSIIFDYDIIKNDKINNRDTALEEFIAMFRLDTVPEYEEKIRYYSAYYFEDIIKLCKKYESVSDVLNKILTKKFAYNMYSNLIKSMPITIYKKFKNIKKGFEILGSEYGVNEYTDLYENLADIMKEYTKDKDILSNKEDYEKTKKLVYLFYTQIDFPQFFNKIGDTPEQILLQSMCSCKEQNYENPNFIMNILEFLNESGNEIGKFRRNVFFNELINNMQTSFNKLIQTENDEKIKECIRLYSKAKYSGKLGFALTQVVVRRKSRKFEVPSENNVFEEMEEKIERKIIEFSKKDFDSCINFLKEIPEFVVQRNHCIQKNNFRGEILPEIMGVKLSADEKVEIDGKSTFDEIFEYINSKKKIMQKTNDIGEYDG